jgi:hypothetical protein
MKEPPPKAGHQKGNMAQGSNWRPTNIRPHRQTKFTRPGHVALWICAPLEECMGETRNVRNTLVAKAQGTWSAWRPGHRLEKSEIKLLLCCIKSHKRHEDVWMHCVILPCILDLGNVWRRVACCTLRPLYPLYDRIWDWGDIVVVGEKLCRESNSVASPYRLLHLNDL